MMESIVVEEKPYKFEHLKSTHLFAMIKLIKKVGIENFKKLLENSEIMSNIFAKGEKTEEQYASIGLIVFDIAALVIDRLEVCEHEVYELLAKTSNLSKEEIEQLPIEIFMEMIVDFIKKEELVAFLKAALKLFK